MNTGNILLHSPQVGVYPAAVTETVAVTIDEIVLGAEAEGAISVHVKKSQDGHEVISTFEDQTRVIEITPEGVFFRLI